MLPLEVQYPRWIKRIGVGEGDCVVGSLGPPTAMVNAAAKLVWRATVKRILSVFFIGLPVISS